MYSTSSEPSAERFMLYSQPLQNPVSKGDGTFALLVGLLLGGKGFKGTWVVLQIRVPSRAPYTGAVLDWGPRKGP